MPHAPILPLSMASCAAEISFCAVRLLSPSAIDHGLGLRKICPATTTAAHLCCLRGDLLPMAYHNPHAKFVGVDLSGSSILRGQQNAATLGLSNIELHHLNILDVGPELGEFDYIISHGVYSWVPDIVRNKMLRIFKENLAPQGVCYVSYNAHPSRTRAISCARWFYFTRVTFPILEAR
jgi:hypothetical protein